MTEKGGRYRLNPELLAASDTYRLHQALRASRASETSREREELLRQALASGARGFLTKASAPESLVDAVRSLTA